MRDFQVADAIVSRASVLLDVQRCVSEERCDAVA